MCSHISVRNHVANIAKGEGRNKYRNFSQFVTICEKLFCKLLVSNKIVVADFFCFQGFFKQLCDKCGLCEAGFHRFGFHKQAKRGLWFCEV